jgi:[protein-PII] uridylyltransferase
MSERGHDGARDAQETARETADGDARRAALKDAARRHWAELAQRLATGEDGLRLGRARASALDALLSDVLPFARAAARGESVTLAAVGSFGRGAVALRSDIDVRIVVGVRGRAAGARFADALLYPLWDSGLTVGHQVTSASEALSLAQTDLATATSLLDLRPIGGPSPLVTELEDRAYAGLFSEGALGTFMARLEEEAASRHARFGGSLYLLEPEVKAGAGGLRDLDVARWAARARFRLKEDPAHGTWAELVRLGVLVAREAHEIARAEEFLWRVRNRLHAHAERKSDRLTFDRQEAIADELGYVPSSGHGGGTGARATGAERFMQDYFGHARVVTRARESLLVRATPPRRRTGKPVEVDLGGGVRLFDGQVTVDPTQLAEDPALALRAYAACVARKAPVLPFARDAITRAAADREWAERLRKSPEAAAAFLELLCSVPEAPLRRGSGSIMGELHEVGLVLAMIPEFQPVTGRVHHDVYHVYTVDVHSVAAVDCLRALCRGDLAHERPVASRLAAEIARPVPLFLATLLHDVGKGYPDASGSRKNHSVTGAELCDAILPRLGVGPEESAEVHALVREHLLMYHVATRRDLDDPSTTTDFCAHVQDREALRNLYLLTVSDITTTSPTAMTSWKASMLDELYFAADGWMAGASSTRALGRTRSDRVRDASLAMWDGEPDVLRRFLASMPERYLLANGPEAIVAHARVATKRAAAAPGEGSVGLSFVPSRHPDVCELCVVADDAPGLLARIAAAITGCRLEVLAAQVYSRVVTASRTEAVDLFWVRDARAEGAAAGGAAASLARVVPRLTRDLEALCKDEVAAPALLAERLGHASPWRERPSPAVLSEVVIDDRASPRHTVVEVFAKDRPGLLFELASALHGLGLSIALSKINTEGTKVADVFYVRELDGSKVQPGARFRVIRETLLAALDPAASALAGTPSPSPSPSTSTSTSSRSPSTESPR